MQKKVWPIIEPRSDEVEKSLADSLFHCPIPLSATPLLCSLHGRKNRYFCYVTQSWEMRCNNMNIPYLSNIIKYKNNKSLYYILPVVIKLRHPSLCRWLTETPLSRAHYEHKRDQSLIYDRRNSCFWQNHHCCAAALSPVPKKSLTSRGLWFLQGQRAFSSAPRTCSVISLPISQQVRTPLELC